MRLLKACISVCFALCFGFVSAQTDTCRFVPKVEIVGTTGRIQAHHEEMKPMCDKPFYAGELRLGVQTAGKKNWHQKLNYPFMGVGFYASEFQKKEIGHPLALFGFMEIPAYRRGNSVLSTSWSCGLAFHINEFDSVSNPGNQAIGTDLNAFIGFSARYKYQLTERMELGGGFSFQHFSNGAAHRPNWGMNMLSVNLIASYLPSKKKIVYQKLPEPEITKRYEFNIMCAAGVHETKNLERFFNSTLSMAFSRRMNYKRTLGLGVDVFYNEYLLEKYPRDERVPLKKLTTPGVFANSDLIAGRLRLNVGLGVYVAHVDEYSVPFYERAGLRFYLHKNVFANMSIKANGGHAEFIEWGMGVTL